MASKHSAFPITEVLASKVPAILKKFISKEALKFDFGCHHFETELGSQAVFM